MFYMSFSALKDLLSRSLRLAKISDQVEAARILNTCSAIIKSLVPPAISRQVTPLHVRHGVLVLQVTSSVVAQEIHFRERVIIDQLDEKFPQHVNRLRFQLTEHVDGGG